MINFLITSQRKTIILHDFHFEVRHTETERFHCWNVQIKFLGITKLYNLIFLSIQYCVLNFFFFSFFNDCMVCSICQREEYAYGNYWTDIVLAPVSREYLFSSNNLNLLHILNSYLQLPCSLLLKISQGLRIPCEIKGSWR